MKKKSPWFWRENEDSLWPEMSSINESTKIATFLLIEYTLT